MFLNQRPLLLPLIGFVVGISLIRSFSFLIPLSFIFESILFFSLPFFIFRHSSLGIVLCSFFLFILVGFFIASLSISKIKTDSNLLSFANDEKSYVIGKIESPCEKKEEGENLVLSVLAIRQGEKIFSAKGGLLLKVDQGNCLFQQGDVVQTYTKIKEPDRFRNFGSFDYPFYLLIQKITASGFVESEDFVVKIGEERNRLESFLIPLREKIGRDLVKLSNPEEREILLALLLGSKNELSLKAQKIFRQTGTIHLLVVSGLHLTMVGGLFYFLIRVLFSLYPSLLLKLPVRKIALFLSFFFVTGYAAFVGFSASVLRSFLFALVGLVILFLLRSKETLGIFIFVAFLILLVWPLLLFDVSFQLSFLSVFSIVILVPRWENFLFNHFEQLFSHRLIRSLVQIILASLAVQIGLFPLLVSYFHQISWVSIPANLVLVPLFTFLLMPIGFLGMFSSWFGFSFAASFFKLTGSILHPFLIFLKWLASLSFSYSYFPSFSLFQFFLFYFCILIWFFPFFRSHRFKIFLVLFGLNIFIWVLNPITDYFDSSLRIHFIDVGQGDSLLLELPHGKRILVDAGGFAQSSFDVGGQVVLPSLFSKKIQSLDYIVITHPHPDHYGGVKALLEPFRPKEIWWNGEKSDADSYQELVAEAARLKIPFKKLDQSTPSFEIEGVRFKVLYPTPNLPPSRLTNGSEVNNHSLVLRLEYRGFRLLLAGDVERETERLLVQSGKLSLVDLLKVPHHGSRTSSSLEFLCDLQPKMGLIGIGRKNWFRFPHPPVLERYQTMGTKIFRTDQDGEINLRWNSEKLFISTFMGKQQELVLKFPILGSAIQTGICRGNSFGY